MRRILASTICEFSNGVKVKDFFLCCEFFKHKRNGSMNFALNNTALSRARHELAGAIAQDAVTPKILSNVMSSAFHGTDASGAWDWRTAYDVMQAAALDVAQLKVGVGHAFAKQGLEVLSEIAARLPQTYPIYVDSHQHAPPL